MPRYVGRATAAFAAIVLSGCVSQPMGPTIAVMPAPGKPFEVFQQDQMLCQQFASQQVAGGAQVANNQQVLTGVLGTVLGAGLGAAIGGGQGAAIGAASGALGGAAVSAVPAQQAQYSLQDRYNIAYAQCMYTRGDQVPGYAPAASSYAQPYGQPSYPPPPYR